MRREGAARAAAADVAAVAVQSAWRGQRARARVVRSVRREFEQAVAAIEGRAGCEWRRATLCRPAWPPRAARPRARDGQDERERDERAQDERGQDEREQDERELDERELDERKQRAQALELRRSREQDELEQRAQALELRRSHLARELARAEEALQRRVLALSQGA
jgi:hypothetical protein